MSPQTFSPDHSAPGAMIPPPNISETDLAKFQKTHFSSPSIEHFSTNFLGPVPDEGIEEEEEEDDDLGYYSDGAKRTLTDEQIAIFRHSEIQTILRERRHAEENGVIHQADRGSLDGIEEGEVDENEETPVQDEIQKPSGKKKRNQKRGQKKWASEMQNIKPDLRKRTWDKVDSGLESLDYGEEVNVESRPAPAQRRRISYDDI